MPVQKSAETDFRASSELFPETTGKSWFATLWKAAIARVWITLIVWDLPGFRRIMYAIDKFTPFKVAGNRRVFRVEDLTEDQANEILEALESQELEPTPHLDHLLK